MLPVSLEEGHAYLSLYFEGRSPYCLTHELRLFIDLSTVEASSRPVIYYLNSSHTRWQSAITCFAVRLLLPGESRLHGQGTRRHTT